LKLERLYVHHYVHNPNEIIVMWHKINHDMCNEL